MHAYSITMNASVSVLSLLLGKIDLFTKLDRILRDAALRSGGW